MKQSINPAVMVIAIVVVLGIACALGFRALNPSDPPHQTGASGMTETQKQEYEQGSKPREQQGQYGSTGPGGGYKAPTSSGH